jgi:hypothetical protein
MTTCLMFVQKPYEDEALYANASYNLANKGFLGIPGFEQRLLGLYDLDKAVWWIPQLSLVTSAGWFKMFGCSLIQQRLTAVMFGLLLLTSMFLILKKLRFTDRSIFVCLLLISTDFLVTRHSADGRICDIMCASLCYAGFAAYMLLRETKFKLALISSNGFIALACLTHPNGLLGITGLGLLIVYYDLNKINVSNVLLVVLPYLAGVISILPYLANNFTAFYSQFFWNIKSAAGDKNVVSMVVSELKSRYLFIYAGLGTGNSIKQMLLLSIPIGYLAGLIYGGFKLSRDRKIKLMFMLSILFIVIFTFVLGKKWPRYLIYIIPLYAACFGYMYDMVSVHKLYKYVLTSVLVVMITSSVSVNVFRCVRNDYGKYLHDTASIKQVIMPAADKVVGPIELGYELGWDRVTDDNTLGFFSKQKYRHIIINNDYDWAFGSFKSTNPGISKHVNAILQKHHIIWSGDIYRLYGN